MSVVEFHVICYLVVVHFLRFWIFYIPLWTCIFCEWLDALHNWKFFSVAWLTTETVTIENNVFFFYFFSFFFVLSSHQLLTHFISNYLEISSFFFCFSFLFLMYPVHVCNFPHSLFCFCLVLSYYFSVVWLVVMEMDMLLNVNKSLVDIWF